MLLLWVGLAVMLSGCLFVYILGAGTGFFVPSLFESFVFFFLDARVVFCSGPVGSGFVCL